MPSANDAKRIQRERAALLRAATYAETLVRVSCTVCGLLSGPTSSHTGAVDHARNKPGHMVTTHTLQAVTYGRPVEGENLQQGTPRGRITPDGRNPTGVVTKAGRP